MDVEGVWECLGAAEEAGTHLLVLLEDLEEAKAVDAVVGRTASCSRRKEQ